MSKAKLHYLASTASDKFLDEDVPLNTSITKIAKEHALNVDELSRVCELANLKTFDSKVKKASKNTVAFDLADAGQISKDLNLTKTAQTKTASLFEYKMSPEFLGAFIKEAATINTSPLTQKLFEQDYPHQVAKELNAAIREKLAAKKQLQILGAGKIGLQFKIASEHAEAVTMIKHAALNKTTNPFVQWPLINKARPDLKEVTDSVFTKAAKELTSTWVVKVEDLLARAKKEAAEALDKDQDLGGQDGTSIVQKLDTISSYQDLYDKVQDSILKTKGSLELHPSDLDSYKVLKTVDNTDKIKDGSEA